MDRSGCQELWSKMYPGSFGLMIFPPAYGTGSTAVAYRIPPWTGSKWIPLVQYPAPRVQAMPAASTSVSCT